MWDKKKAHKLFSRQVVDCLNGDVFIYLSLLKYLQVISKGFKGEKTDTDSGQPGLYTRCVKKVWNRSGPSRGHHTAAPLTVNEKARNVRTQRRDGEREQNGQ